MRSGERDEYRSGGMGRGEWQHCERDASRAYGVKEAWGAKQE